MPHRMQQYFLDGSKARKPVDGGYWEVKCGPTNGAGYANHCLASYFVAAQNRWIMDWHEDAVRAYRGAGARA